MKTTFQLYDGCRVRLRNGDVHLISMPSQHGEARGNTPFYTWYDDGEISHAAMEQDHEIIEVLPPPEIPTPDAVAEAKRQLDESFGMLDPDEPHVREEDEP